VQVPQLYTTNDGALYPGQPRWALAGFDRVDVPAGASVVVYVQRSHPSDPSTFCFVESGIPDDDDVCVCVCVCVAASASHRWVEHGANHTHVTFPKKRLTGVHLARRFGLLPPSRTFALPPLARAEVREEDFARWVSAAVHQGSVIQVLFSYNGTLRWRPIFPRTDWHPGLVSVGRGVP